MTARINNGAVSVIVCGGRDYADKEELDNALSFLWLCYPKLHLIAGGARGADRLAARWAHENGVDCEEVEADWETYGKRAGVLRNTAMLARLLRRQATGQRVMVLAFRGGKGTANMCEQAVNANVRVWRIDPSQRLPEML
jgi:hypothetical protein